MKNLIIFHYTYNFTILIILTSLTVIISGNSTAGELFKLNNSTNNLSDPNTQVSPPLDLPRPSSFRSPKSKFNTKSVLASAAGALTVTLTIVILLYCTLLLRRRRRQRDEEKASPAVIEDDQPLCRLFTIEEIITATNNFDPDLGIEDGGYGRVYKGYIDDHNPVAIKVLKKISKLGICQFETEVELLSKLRHPHLVSLIGYCNDQQHMIIVFDYMKNGTLRDHLYCTDNPPLSWKQRLEICIGAARGLVYLHGAAERGIIHRDGFGFWASKLGPESPSKSHVTTEVNGTFGYMDPNYYWTKHLTLKSDVYGFGVVLFEVLCARPVVDMGLDEEQQSLAQWAHQNVKNGTLDQIIDQNLGRDCTRELEGMSQVLRALEFALELQEGAVGAKEGIEIEVGSGNKCWGGGKEMIVRGACKDGVVLVHSCPTIWQKSTSSNKMLMRFLSDSAGLKWATTPTSRALKALCFTCSSSSFKFRDGEGLLLSKKNDPLPFIVHAS
ncbi:hypothetical protein UlMin_014559 [Ulmus minor]